MAKSEAKIPSAPVFFPSEEEFKSPLDYISKIRPLAEPFGICRIVPPSSSWHPPSSFSLSSFPTKSQSIHLLQSRSPSLDHSTFSLDYSRFLLLLLPPKKPPPKPPLFESKEIDLCLLFNAVKRFGGFANVSRNALWGKVVSFLRPGLAEPSQRAKTALSQLYRDHLLDYETHRGGAHLPAPTTNESVVDQICEQCKSGLHGDVMLLCDRCDKGWHLHCLTQPMDAVPPGNWYCLECVNSDKDSFGFVPGKKKCSLATFRRRNDRARRKWLGQGGVSRETIEKRFWDIVEGRGGEVEVIYGSDLDTSVYGSGFPRVGDPVPDSVDAEVWKEYCSSPWNLNNLPKLPGSMLQAVHDNIAGVMVPWLYMGMLFSSFCWHVEDHFFYSINYLHW